jgi:hypothetical protein
MHIQPRLPQIHTVPAYKASPIKRGRPRGSTKALTEARREALIEIINAGKPNAGEKIEETLRELAPDAEIYFERIAVTPEQIAEWDLPMRPTKASDTRAKAFGSSLSVELDAIEPNQLRQLVQEAIEIHLPPEQFEVLKAAEESEREIISRLVGKATRKRRR